MNFFKEWNWHSKLIVLEAALSYKFKKTEFQLDFFSRTFTTRNSEELERNGIGKVLPENKTITLVSHNECYMPGGYSITDGGVTPSSDKARMDANLQKIKALNPDIVCLYELTLRNQDALGLFQSVKNLIAESGLVFCNTTHFLQLDF